MDDDSFPWRTVVSAVFALGIVGTLAWAGWGLLQTRLGDESSDPSASVSRFLAAVNDDRPDELDAATGDPEAFLAALDTAFGPLDPGDVTVAAADAEVDGAAAVAGLTWAIAGGPADGTSWTSTLVLERRRGDWAPAVDVRTVHPDLRPGWTFDIERQNAVRATIDGIEAVPLTAGGGGVVLGIEPRRLRSPDRLLGAWASALPDSYGDLEELLARDDLVPSWFYPVVTLSSSRWDAVEDDFRGIPGFIDRDVAEATSDDTFARHVLGRVDVPTAEMIEQGAVEGRPIGLYGLEAVFEDRLVGGESATVVLRESDGDVNTTLTELSEDPAQPLSTTLDRGVQEAVEAAIDTVDGNAAVVVLDTADAAIRASASRPLTGYNRAFGGRYAPGDAIVVVTVDAFVAGGVDFGQEVTCPAEDAVAGAQLVAPRPGGRTTLAAAMGQGCDTSTGAVAAGLDPELFAAAGERTGFGVPIGLPLEVSDSSFPDVADPTAAVRVAVGQGEVLSSPLHLASTLVAGVTGTWRPPYLLADEGSADDADEDPDAEDSDDDGDPDTDGEGDESVGGDPGEGRALTAGTGGALAAVLAAGEPLSGVPSIVGTAERRDGGGFVTDAWAVTVVDDLAIVVLVEDVTDEAPARAVLARFLAERP